MLYLIKSFGRSKNNISLKVGYASDLKKRMTTYRTQNPFFELISSRSGELIDETRVHLYLEIMNLKEDFLNEWFKNDDTVNQRFHDSFEKMNKFIWENRSKLFSIDDFKRRNTKCELYEELRLIYQIQDDKLEIDRLWRSTINRKIVKSYQLSFL